MAYVSSDQFCLVTTKLRKTGDLSDGKIILDDGSEFKIHKILLAAGSPFFERLFTCLMAGIHSAVLRSTTPPQGYGFKGYQT